MPQYTDSTELTWNYTESDGNATIGTGGGFSDKGSATILGTDLSGAITIPSTVDGYTVTGIDGYAFYNCTNLTSIDLSGTQVETIGLSAFVYCTSLTSVDLSGTQVASIGWQAFSQCTRLETIHNIPNSLTNIDRYAFYACTKLTSIDLSGTQVTTLAGQNFYYCTSLTLIDLPNSLISIGEYAFRECSSLETIDLSGTQVTTIGQNAFKDCTSLETIDLGNSVTTIGESAFYNCTSLETIDLPNSVTTIGNYAFRSCTSLTSITIPDSVTSIGSYAFGAVWAPIGSPSTVYVKDVDPTDEHTMATLQNTMSGKISGTVTYEVEPNYAPNTPTLSDISCNENTPYNATVSATDDNGDILTFSLSGADAADFTLSGTTLSAIDVFDFETKETYNITITASDGTYSTPAEFTIQVVDVNENTAPTNITLSSTTIDENAASGTVIGDLSCNDPEGDNITYTVDDITNFEISGSQLLSKKEFNYETTPSYNITITASDGSLSNNLSFTITVNNVNEVPTNITLSSTTIDENVASGTVIGDLSCNDPEGDNITYTVDDITNFEISGSQLLSKKEFNYETDDLSYNITITASDGSLSNNQSFTITVNNVVETASELFNTNVQGTELKTSADNDGVTTQQLRAAGYSSQQLYDAGYAFDELLAAGYEFDNLIAAGICFPADTPVNTDQGTVAIDKIDVSKHTIRGKRIVAITQTITHEKHIVCIKKDAFAKNVPSQDTLTTQNHCFFYNGNMVKAKHLVNKLDNVVLVKYDGCILYNVLQDKHETMVINNLIAETFYPEHGIAKMYRYFSENKVSPEMQYNIMVQVANEYKKKNLTK